MTVTPAERERAELFTYRLPKSIESGAAVVLHSGGQDSSTCLAWTAKEVGPDNVYPIAFHYNQRHAVELQQADRVCAAFGVRPPQVLPAEALSAFGSEALTNPSIKVEAKSTGVGNAYATMKGLPSTFVPGRNMLFLTIATAYGAAEGIFDLVTGVCEADDAGYPDCRGNFVAAAQHALTAALDEQVRVHAPLLRRSKALTFALAEELGVLETIIEETHTCYQGDRSIKHPWGYGCGECPACVERAKGWAKFTGVMAAND